MATITYKNKEYPTRTFMVLYDEEKETDKPHQITVSVESLSEELMKDTEDFTDYSGKHGAEAEAVDNQIYYYVIDSVINLSGKEVCENVDEVRFVSEIIDEV